MPSNVTMNDGTGSIKAATKQITHDGDSAQVQGVELLIVSGSEDSYAAADLTGGAGAVAAGTPRVTLASDDPAVTKLAGGLPAALGSGGGLKVDGSGTALPISAASLPLPSGAATAAKQPALGTAGTPSADVITVQGVTSMTALKIDGSGVTQPVSGPLTDTQLRATAVPVSGTVAVSAISSALPSGTNAIGKLSANSGVDIGDVDVTSIAAGANLIGDVGLQPRTSGGLSFTKLISAASTNLTQVKATGGQIYAIYATNINAAVRYLKIYNAASASVTVGTTVPDLTLPIPASATGAGFFLKWPQGVAFGTGISFALTTGVADNDTGAVAANELTVHVFYK